MCEILEQLGRKVRRVRRDNDITQEELADMWGCNTATISNIERGKTFSKRRMKQIESFIKKYGKNIKNI